MEFTFTLLMLVPLVGCYYLEERYHEQDKRIVNGKEARKGGFPWQVSIYYQNDLICGGTLISMNYVMTAAHCFGTLKENLDNLVDFMVRMGENDRGVQEDAIETRGMANVIKHEFYQDGDIHANDIAIVILDEEATQNYRIFPACLPEPTDELSHGYGCVLTGWGREFAWGETSKLLQELSTPIVGLAECREKNQKEGWKVTPHMLCTGRKGTYSSGCMGDSGGPLSCIQENSLGRWKVYGVVSWGSQQCNGLDKYTVYTKVIDYLGWIKEKTGVRPTSECFREEP